MIWSDNTKFEQHHQTIHLHEMVVRKWVLWAENGRAATPLKPLRLLGDW